MTQAANHRKRIGVTQRVTTALYGQPHDCLDHAWADLFAALGADFLPLPNLDAAATDVSAYLDSLNIDGIVLSGGNDIAGLSGETKGSQASLRRDNFERHVIAHVRARAIPLLGVCRGMQFLNVELKGELALVGGHANTRHRIKKNLTGKSPIFDALPDAFDVNSYHNYAIPASGLASELKIAATDEVGYVEACFHPNEPLAAIMWHPEREPSLRDIDQRLMTTLFRL